MDTLAHHLRHAARGLIRAPGFSLTATLTLALGIGLSTAVFTVADAVLLRRLPVADQDRLVVLWGATNRFANFPLALDDIREFERRSQTLEDIAFFPFRGATPVPIRAADRTWPMQTALVSGNWFDVLQAPPALGRPLRPEDDVAGAPPVIVLSHQAWLRWFGGDSTVIGRRITTIQAGQSHTIVGVMRPGLDYPRGTEMWVPLVAYSSAGGFLEVVARELDMLGRLRPGASASQARAELSSFLARPDAPAMYRDVGAVVHSFPDIVLGDTRPALLLITLAAGLLLLIACVNVANLLLVRAVERVKEFAVRTALGASRGRVIAQLLAESGLLALAGGLLGVGLAMAAVSAFVSLAPGSFPHLGRIGVDGSALVAAAVITTAAMLVSGLAPAVFTSRSSPQDALRSGSRQSGGRGVRRTAEMLVVAQIALAAVSLTAAGLLTRSLIELYRVELSFDRDRLLVASLVMAGDAIPDPPAQREALDVVLAGTRALPGVEDVTPVYAVPFIGAGGGVDGRIPSPEQSSEEQAANPMLNLEVTAPNYFAMLGIPVLRGRAFSDADREGAARVIIVSSSVARHFWPDSDPIGKQLGSPGRELTVVGEVADTRYRELRTARPTVYFPLRQSPFLPTTLLIRTAGSPADIAPALRRAVSDAHPGVSVASATPLPTLLAAGRAQDRLNTVVLALFAVAALVLAAIGLFAIIATMVRQRTHELGIRMALGATAGDVRRIVMVRGLLLAVAGAVIGMGVALATGRVLSSLLFGIAPTDGVTLASVAALMLVVAGVASFVPARTSTRIDPMIALRSES